MIRDYGKSSREWSYFLGCVQAVQVLRALLRLELHSTDNSKLKTEHILGAAAELHLIDDPQLGEYKWSERKK